MHHRIIFKEPQHVSKRVDQSQGSDIGRIAQSFLRHGRDIGILDGGVGDFSWLEDCCEFIETRVGHSGNTNLHRSRAQSGFRFAPVRIVNRDVLPTCGSPMMAVLIWLVSRSCSGCWVPLV